MSSLTCRACGQPFVHAESATPPVLCPECETRALTEEAPSGATSTVGAEVNPEVDLPSERPLERNPYAGPVAGSLTFLTCVVVLSAMAAMMFGDTSSGDLSLLKNIGQGAGFGLILSGVVLLIYWLYVLLQISAKANQEELEFRRTIREERRARKLARREEIEAEETSEPPPPVASQPDERITNPSRLQRQRPASQADPVQDTGDDSIN